MKLSVKSIEIPTKEVNIEGFGDTITIYPIGGFALLKLQKLAEHFDGEDTEKAIDAVKFALKWGCKCEDDDIEFLIENDAIACMELTKAILEFSTEYTEMKYKESSLAKKKLKK